MKYIITQTHTLIFSGKQQIGCMVGSPSQVAAFHGWTLTAPQTRSLRKHGKYCRFE